MVSRVMPSADIAYKMSTASEDEILAHLSECNDSFIPPLSKRVDLRSYAKKIFEKAITFEAWSDNKLAGLLAAYVNDNEQRIGYITNMSVLPQFPRTGIGSQLLTRCLDHAAKADFREICLEVNRSNGNAISLYQKHHFIKTDENGEYVIMTWKSKKISA